MTRLGPDARWRAITGTLLIGFGGALTLVTLLAALGFVPLFQPTVPPPVALQTPAAAPLLVAPRSPSATALPPLAAAPLVPEPAMLPIPAPTPSPSPTWPPTTAPVRPSSTIARRLPTRLSLPPPSVTPVPTATATPLPTPVPPPPPPGLPVRLRIPSIGVDTPVVELDMVEDPAEGWRWETVPFVAGHYPITGLVGGPSNVLIAGHVATRDQGNVFRDLYRVRLGDPVVVYTAEGEFTYRVAEVRLVRPEEVEVLQSSPSPRLSLLTCAGSYDFRTRSFSHRLVVIGELVR
ncbi:MAG TPA: sortase [Chloroflexota bacterium]|nr:sortase [Chloroflexota bacterium]